MRIRHALALTALIGLSVALVTAQAPQGTTAAPGQSLKGVVLKGKAPVSKEILKVSLPKPQEFDLANLVHVLVLEDHRLPLISFQVIVPGAGGYFDPPDLPGLASFAGAMMREGTTTKTSAEISQQLETIAASLNVSVGMSSVTATISGSTLTENVDAVLGLAGDILLNPSFSEEELGRYKTRTNAALMQNRSMPNFLSVEMVNRVLYGSHPASRTAPTPDALGRATRAMLVEFHRTHYVPDNALIAIVGDISVPAAKQKLTAVFGPWKKAGVAKPTVQEPAPVGAGHGVPREPARVGAVERRGRGVRAFADQRRLRYVPGAERNHRRWPYRAPVPEPSRGQGVDLRGVQLGHGVASPR